MGEGLALISKSSWVIIWLEKTKIMAIIIKLIYG